MSSPSPSEIPLVPMPPGRRRAITGALLLGTFMASLEVMVVSPAMPNVVAEFGGAGLYPWVFTSYIAAQTATIPLYGRMSDRQGRRDAFLLGLSLFLLGSVLCAVAGSMEGLVAARTIQGLGAGALIPLTVTVLGDLYPVAERTKLQGAFSLIWGVSSLLGPLAGGIITETLSWRAIFWLNLAPGLLTGLLVGLLLPGHVGRGPARKREWVTFRLLRDATQQAINGSGLVLGAALLGVIGYLPVFVQAVQGGSALDAGLALIPMSISWTIFANVAGRLVRFTGFRNLVRIGTITTAIGAVIAGVWTAHWFGLLLFGSGMGFTISAYNVAAQESAPREHRGQATSLSLFSRSIGSAISVPVFGLVAGIDPSAVEFSDVVGLEDGVGRVFVGIAICAVLAAAIAAGRFPRSSSP